MFAEFGVIDLPFCADWINSKSGKILYFIVDRFLVQWEELHAQYSKSEYLGRRRRCPQINA